MRVELNGTGKRFQWNWILRDINLSLPAGSRWAVGGPNGSGKSTLLKMLSGHLSPSAGQIRFFRKDEPVSPLEVYRHVAFVAPYIELIEEFTLSEALLFHRKFNPLLPGLSPSDLVDLLGFQKNARQEIRYFSSGMKQRLKLVLGFCTRADLLLLDEPTTNLDEQGSAWYLQLAERFLNKQTVVVASNVQKDFAFCDQTLHVLDYKGKSGRS